MGSSIDYLVLDALAAHGLLKLTALNIAEYLKATFYLQFEEAEINASGKRLASKNLITYDERGRFDRPLLQIQPQTEQTITSNCKKLQTTEQEVLDKWKAELHGRYKTNQLVIKNIDRIADNLQAFITKILRRHGVESVALLYPDETRARSWLVDQDNVILEELTEIDPFTDAITRLEIPRFFRTPDSQRQSYISSLFNSSFFWHLIQIDEKCSRLLTQVTRGQRLYLDNNVLYCLVGFNGSEIIKSEHAMLRMAGDLGYGLWITTKTLDEFQNSLRWRMDEMKEKPPMPAELAKMAVDNLGSDSFLTSYWKELAQNRTSMEEFIAEKSHVDSLLEGLNIRKTNKFRKEIERSQELQEEESILRSVTWVEMSDYIIEHDAFHRVFINRVRNEPKFRLSEAVAWFLTHDAKLPAYSRAARKGKNCLPFCITTDQWIQVNRPLLVRTKNEKELEESYHALVTQPFLRSMISSFSMERAYQEVLGRLSRYKSMNPEFVLKIASDTHFMVSFALEPEGADKEEKIDNKAAEVAARSYAEQKVLERHVGNERKKVNELEIKYEELKKRYIVHEREISVFRDNLEIVRGDKKKAEHRIDKLKDIVQKLNSRKEELEAEITKYRIGVKKWVTSIGLIAIVSFALWAHHFWLHWTWLSAHSNLPQMKLACQFLIIFLLLWYPLRKHWKLWLLLAAACIGWMLILSVS